jgi:hypothetical protein
MPVSGRVPFAKDTENKGRVRSTRPLFSDFSSLASISED